MKSPRELREEHHRRQMYERSVRFHGDHDQSTHNPHDGGGGGDKDAISKKPGTIPSDHGMPEDWQTTGVVLAGAGIRTGRGSGGKTTTFVKGNTPMDAVEQRLASSGWKKVGEEDRMGYRMSDWDKGDARLYVLGDGRGFEANMTRRKK